MDPSTAAQIGRLLGADAVIIGSITQFNLERSGSDVNVGFLALVLTIAARKPMYS
ncbi:MAG: CsgG/HfaB family protein [Thermosynechococcus sp.]|uniref:CsgG/HfaB family protein n=1 Tax=Thermosynechococcus sp. TaxID=2814275 RepID=UPI0039190441